MSYVTFLNFYQTTLAAALSSTATSMSVSSVTGLPSSLASGQFIPMTLTPASSPGSAYEIVYVTGISGSSLTVTRGEEGTSALNWNTGDILYSTNTAETTGTSMGSPSTDFQTNTLTASGLITANDGIDVAGGTLTIPNATASNQAVALGQVLSVQSGTVYQNISPSPNTTYTQNVSFTAPCNGTVLAFTVANSAPEGSDSNLYLSINGGTLENEVVSNATLATSNSYSVESGSSNTITATLITGSTADAGITFVLSFIFVPTP